MKDPLIFFVFLLLLMGCSKSQHRVLNNPPNIILIVADDLGYADMSATKLSNDIVTPNIDRIANSGVRFSQAYVSSPICNVSRTGIITGVYPQRMEAFWYSNKGMHDNRFKTIPELLRTRNYKTGYIGKIHYGDDDSDILSRNFPLNHGFDYFFGHTSARKHYFNHRDTLEQTFLKKQKKINGSFILDFIFLKKKNLNIIIKRLFYNQIA